MGELKLIPKKEEDLRGLSFLIPAKYSGPYINRSELVARLEEMEDARLWCEINNNHNDARIIEGRIRRLTDFSGAIIQERRVTNGR